MIFLIFILAMGGGFLCIIYSKWITDNTTRIDFCEHYLGGGGTYILWKIIGLGLIAFGFISLFYNLGL